MRITSRLAINLFGVLVLGIVMVGWVVSSVVGGGAFEQPFHVVADFEHSGGVFTNQEVTYRGVLIGKVGELELNEDGVDIELVIDSEWEDEIPADVIANVQSKSAVGEQFVNLTPESEGGATLGEGDRIDRVDTRLPVDFQELLSSLDRVLHDLPPETTRRLISNLADGIGGRSEEIATILRSLGTLSDSFASVAPEQKRLLENATVAGAEFLRTKDAFADAIRAADEVFAGIGDEPEELAELFRANDRFARAGIKLLARRQDDLQRGIGALAEFVEFQLEEREQIERSLEYIPQFLHAIEDASIPWRSPDGREFYRLRVAQVVDDVPSTWPCKYSLPDDYERLPHIRDKRKVVKTTNCLPQGEEDSSDRALATSLITALKQWAEENPQVVDAAVKKNVPPVPQETIPKDGLMWPVSGPVISGFDGEAHEGIDIGASEGSPVGAAAAGTVSYVGDLGDYGLTVVLAHPEGLFTLYGHLSALAVETDQQVEAGEIIGAVGCSGVCEGPHLHFEVRIEGVAVDPLDYLPGGRLFSEQSRTGWGAYSRY